MIFICIFVNFYNINFIDNNDLILMGFVNLFFINSDFIFDWDVIKEFVLCFWFKFIIVVIY